jgi:pimeloyl-ACP methyl ester carboxylesterase
MQAGAFVEFEFKSEYFKYEDQTIHFVQAGSGPSIVFMHNGGADSQTWVHQLNYFKKNFHVIAFDFLGYGKSDRPNKPYTLSEQTKLLTAFIKHHRLERPILVGNCVGASTAIEFAKLNSDQVSKLILFNICGGSSFVPAMKFVEIFPSLAFYLSWISNLKFFRTARVLWGVKPKENDPLFQHYLRNIFLHPKFLQSRVNMLLGTKTFNAFGRSMSLPKSFPPSILFWGEKNKIMPFKYSKICREYLPNSAFYSLPNAGHLCFYEEASEVNSKIEEFLSN